MKAGADKMQKVYEDGTVSEPEEVEAEDLQEKMTKALAKPHVVEVRLRRAPTINKAPTPKWLRFADWLHQLDGSWKAVLGGREKPREHSHSRENARRRRQIERGIIKP